MNFLKPGTSLSLSQRRLSSDQINENYLFSVTPSSQNKPNQHNKKSSNATKKKNKSSTSSLNPPKTHLVSSLKGLLSPIDYKLVETPKYSSIKLDEGAFKPVFKGASARNASEYNRSYKEQDQVEEVFLPSSMHTKKRSLDMNFDQGQNLQAKSKYGNSHILFQNQGQPYSHLFLKDVQYLVNPMFSPVNGPSKQSTRSQNNSGEADSLQNIGLKRENHSQESKRIFH